MNELTYNGKEYLTFEIPANKSTQVQTSENELYFEFKTTRPTGLLTYVSIHDPDYFLCALQDGGLLVKINMNNQVYEKILTIPGIYLHNNDWHSVRITRTLKNVCAFWLRLG
jgi:hypothetical protein